jgi:hypothetical protein
MMRILIILAIAILAGSCALAQKNPASGRTPGSVSQIHRNLQLGQAIQARSLRIKGFLQPETRIKLDQAVRVLLVYMTPGSKHINFLALARQEVQSRFSTLSIDQSHLLCFYILAEVARQSTVQAGQNTSQDTMSGLSEERAKKLQEAAEKRSEVENTLSNVLKAGMNLL